MVEGRGGSAKSDFILIRGWRFKKGPKSSDVIYGGPLLDYLYEYDKELITDIYLGLLSEYLSSQIKIMLIR